MIVPPGLQLALALGRLDHAQADPILDRAARVEVFELGDHRRVDAGGERLEPHQRGVADQLEHGGIRAGHRPVYPGRRACAASAPPAASDPYGRHTRLDACGVSDEVHHLARSVDDLKEAALELAVIGERIAFRRPSRGLPRSRVICARDHDRCEAERPGESQRDEAGPAFARLFSIVVASATESMPAVGWDASLGNVLVSSWPGWNRQTTHRIRRRSGAHASARAHETRLQPAMSPRSRTLSRS